MSAWQTSSYKVWDKTGQHIYKRCVHDILDRCNYFNSVIKLVVLRADTLQSRVQVKFCNIYIYIYSWASWDGPSHSLPNEKPHWYRTSISGAHAGDDKKKKQQAATMLGLVCWISSESSDHNTQRLSASLAVSWLMQTCQHMPKGPTT